MSTFGRTRIVVASPSEIIRQSLWRVIRAFTMGQDAFEFSDENSLLAAGPEEIAAFLGLFPAEALMRTVCILDLSNEPTPTWRLLRDLHSHRPTGLSWRFPEVYWIFIVREKSVPENIWKEAQDLHFVALNDLPKVYKLLGRHSTGFRTWFDPACLRASALMPDTDDGSSLKSKPQGLVFDDELNFAAFNSYLLYRRGICTRMIGTAAEFRAVETLVKAGGEYVILEDVELNFSDSTEKELVPFFVPAQERVNEVLKQRLPAMGFEGGNCPTLRIIVSSSKVDMQRSVIKPFSGLYDQGILSPLQGILSPLKGKLKGKFNGKTSVSQGDANQSAAEDTSRKASGHSAPVAHQAVAGELLVRVRALQHHASDTVTAVHAALLAFEAERLLGYQTYAMAVETLSTRHALEVVAESAFTGTADDLEVNARIRDLLRSMFRLVFHCNKSIEVVGTLLPWREAARDNWRKLHKRCIQVVNGMLASVGQLRENYRRFNKFDEEELALRKVRQWRLYAFLLRSDLPEFMLRHSPRFSKTWLGRGFCWLGRGLENAGRILFGAGWGYLNFVIIPSRLIVAVLGWVLLFAWYYKELASAQAVNYAAVLGFWDWFRHSVVTFLSLTHPIIGGPKLDGAMAISTTLEGIWSFWTLTIIEMALGYLHLAVFVALLVQKGTRR